MDKKTFRLHKKSSEGKRLLTKKKYDDLENELIKERSKAEEYLKKLQYLQAEFENYQRRVKKEIEYAIKGENENGEELILQYSTKTLEELEEEEKLEEELEEEPTIINTLKEGTESVLSPETIIKYAIEKGIVTDIENYNQLLELLGTKFVPLRKIIKITRNKIYVQQ